MSGDGVIFGAIGSETRVRRVSRGIAVDVTVDTVQVLSHPFCFSLKALELHSCKVRRLRLIYSLKSCQAVPLPCRSAHEKDGGAVAARG